MFEVPTIDWQKLGGLCPAVIQDAHTFDVLMLGYMNEESLRLTAKTGQVTFYSRSRSQLWKKGETSGNNLEVKAIYSDCDADSLLIRAIPQGPTCHKGVKSCFTEDKIEGVGFLKVLDDLIATRKSTLPEGSYTTELFKSGLHRMAQKVGEEGVEVALAAKDDEKAPLVGELADLIFHAMVLGQARDISIEDIVSCLRERHRHRH